MVDIEHEKIIYRVGLFEFWVSAGPFSGIIPVFPKSEQKKIEIKNW